MAHAALAAAKKHSHAPKTVQCYAKHLKHARAWLEEYASTEKFKNASNVAFGSTADPDDEIADEDGGPKSDDSDFSEDEASGTAHRQDRQGGESSASCGSTEPDALVLDPEFHDAFDGSPKAYTPLAISLYLWWKCIHGSCGIGTADQIHAAFLKHYNDLGEDTFRGQWYSNIDSDTPPRGNPTRSGRVQSMMTAIKHTGGEPERRHSRAMSRDDMETLHDHIGANCPGPEKMDGPSLMARAEYLQFKALSTLGFTIWTRNCEAIQLQFRDFNFEHPPRRASNGMMHPCIVVSLRNRKNWQRKMAKGDHQLAGHVYFLYPKQHSRAVDAYTAITEWKEFYESLIGRPLEDDDMMFPKIGANGVIYPKSAITTDQVQKKLTKISKEAGLPNADRFTTHCFRRGGAQYRHMFALGKQKWKMNRIRWWGGWAEKENKNTLIRYLLDELSTYEEDHSNALCPDDEIAGNLDPDEDPAERPLTQADGFKMVDTIAARFEEAQRSMVAQVAQGIVLTSLRPEHHLTKGSPLPTTPTSILCPPRHYPMCAERPDLLHPPPPPRPQSRQLVQPVQPSQHYSPYPQQSRPSQSDDRPRSRQPAPSQQRSSSRALVPIPTRHLLVVPRIDLRPSEVHKAWEMVVKDWEDPDPRRSPTPLCEWDYSQLKDANQRMQYHYRRTIATEFIEGYGRDRDMFLRAYPEALRGMVALCNAIKSRHQGTGKVKQRARLLGRSR
ncbi:hypothetical protein BKA70DRAFT_1107246 [Coprinopsis sp. MPI-PUGE-AT-0042]|nr:hypothetical protein BKA70DRAFT_1107246 [Coprinopsis sp. MPI-PUGE-AT-0042]